MANAYAMLAGRGVSYTPHLVAKIVNNLGEVKIMKGEKHTTNYNKEYMDLIEKAMIQVIESGRGTGKVLRTPGLKIAAKTGSAENSKYNVTHGWIAGYFPVENPEIAFTSFVEGGGHGGEVSGKISKFFIDAYLEKYKKD